MWGYDGVTGVLAAVTVAGPYGPATGLTGLVARVTDRADGREIVAALPLSEVAPGSGVYAAVLDPALVAGAARVGLVVTDAMAAQVAEAVAWPRQRVGCTRRDLRRRVALRLSDEEQVWLQVATEGDEQSALLPELAIGGNIEHRGLWVWIGSGANAYRERRVVSETLDPPVVYWEPPLPAFVAAGDRVELYPMRPSRLNEAIEDAVRLLDDALLIDAEECVIRTDGTATTFPLPADCRQVVDVALEADPLPLGGGVYDWLAPDDWAIDPGGRLRLTATVGWSPLWPTGTPTAPPAGWRIRIRMRCAAPRPVHDDLWLPVLPEAIVDAAAEQIALAIPSLRTLLPTFAQRATQSRLRATSGPPGGARDVPR